MEKHKLIVDRINREFIRQAYYKRILDKSRGRVTELRKKLTGAYPQFLDECYNNSPNEFVNIEKFPITEEIRSFYQYSGITKDNIPLYEYGWFEIKELAAIIKVLYSLKKQEEYQIITFANFDIEYNGPELSDRELTFYMNFIIGLDRKINYIDEYNGRYLNATYEGDLSFFEQEIIKPFNKANHQDLIRLKQKGQKQDSSLGIEFEHGRLNKKYLYYYDPIFSMSRFTTFSSEYNIFDRYTGNVIRKLDNNPLKNIGGLLSFSLDIEDNFIAMVLFNIVIYKKKMGKIELDNDDYKYIFYELFREFIDISKIVDKEIPKKLIRSK